MSWQKLKNAARRELHQLVHPYYWMNLILCLSFIGLRLIDPICHWTFGSTWESLKQEDCELDGRESEILFFLMVVIMVRSRKTGSTASMTSYLTSGFVCAKVANVILFFRTDPRYGLVYCFLFAMQAMLLPEPTYKGPENITYFRANGLEDELRRDPKVTWLVTFYAAWSPSSVNFSPIFAKISANYGLPNLKFGKLDVGRYPEVADKHLISTSALTRQLPTVIMFQEGKEVGRVPAIVAGKVQKFMFKEEEIVQIFDLNNLYAEARKDKRYAAQIKAMDEKAAAEALEEESKKTK